MNKIIIKCQKKFSINFSFLDDFESNAIAEDVDELVSEFNETFEENVNSISERHEQELSELSTLRKNYKRLLLRSTGHTKNEVETAIDNDRQKTVKKLLRKKDKERLEHLLKSQEYHDDIKLKQITVREIDETMT